MRTPTSPTLAGALPTLVPGETATIDGANFAADPAANVVTIGGVRAEVRQAAPTRLTVRVPGADALGCRPSRVVPVSVHFDMPALAAASTKCSASP